MGELVKAEGNGLPMAVDAAQHRLPELIASADRETLHEYVAGAEAVQKYHERNGHMQAANQAARLKIECEAALGLIDLDTNAWKESGSIRIGEYVVAATQRSMWRKLAMAKTTGELEGVLTGLSDSDVISTRGVYNELLVRGIGWTSPEPFRTRLKCLEDRGVSRQELAKTTGVPKSHVSNLLNRRGPERVSLPVALKMAEMLDIPPSKLKPMPPKQPRHRTTSRLRRPKPVKGDFIEAHKLFLKVEAEVYKKTGDSSTYNDLWKLLHDVEDLLRDLKVEEEVR